MNAFLNSCIPFVLEVAALLTALIRPNHLGKLSSWGLIHLSPHCNSNYFGDSDSSIFRNFSLDINVG
ncbi:MAG TPA: hypothetical protein DEV85_05225 [Vibrio sp.]|uniref:Uncharacterized protein n=1 Tax=Vibrio casei TaxID=673372 RepID=A0A368LK61_9VIBR|nr:hypothetical protein CIK83_00955 [Vibrio casei]HBV77965.1 hypothetical protein [Vibrio sp.]HCH01283.1 hypothetical protein [Vibrio sp.]